MDLFLLKEERPDDVCGGRDDAGSERFRERMMTGGADGGSGSGSFDPRRCLDIVERVGESTLLLNGKEDIRWLGRWVLKLKILYS